MEKEQLYQTIEAYLEGKLAGEELVAFERELATDRTLAQEVALHRSLQTHLGDSPKLDLRATLDEIAQDFPESDLDLGDHQGDADVPTTGSAGGVPFWMWGLVFFLLIGGGVSWYLLTMEDESVPALSTEASEQVPESDATQEEPATDQQETSPVPDEEPASTPQNEAPATDNRAQAYDTNRELELRISDEPPSKRYEFTAGDLTYTQGYITFSSNLLTSRSVEEGFFLNLYTNQYPEGRIFREPLTFSEVKEDAPIAFGGAKKEYVAAYTGETDLQPALYYGVVTTGDSSIALWVGKVRVE